MCRIPCCKALMEALADQASPDVSWRITPFLEKMRGLVFDEHATAQRGQAHTRGLATCNQGHFGPKLIHNNWFQHRPLFSWIPSQPAFLCHRTSKPAWKWLDHTCSNLVPHRVGKETSSETKITSTANRERRSPRSS